MKLHTVYCNTSTYGIYVYASIFNYMYVCFLIYTSNGYYFFHPYICRGKLCIYNVTEVEMCTGIVHWMTAPPLPLLLWYTLCMIVSLMHHLIDPTCTYLLHSCIGVPEESPGGCGGWSGALPVLWSGCGSNITPDSGTGSLTVCL